MGEPQTPVFRFRTVPAVPMALPAPLAFGPPAAAEPFQWTGLPAERILRNVSAPRLYPVLPAPGRGSGRQQWRGPAMAGCGSRELGEALQQVERPRRQARQRRWREHQPCAAAQVQRAAVGPLDAQQLALRIGVDERARRQR